MVKAIKIRVQQSNDEELVEECRKAVHYSQKSAIHNSYILISIQVGCGECYPITWTTPSKATPIEPPPNTMAVIVNLVDDQGVVRMYKKESNIWVDTVGTEEAGYMVILPWQSTWWFRVSGSLRVGYVKLKDAK